MFSVEGYFLANCCKIILLKAIRWIICLKIKYETRKVRKALFIMKIFITFLDNKNFDSSLNKIICILIKAIKKLIEMIEFYVKKRIKWSFSKFLVVWIKLESIISLKISVCKHVHNSLLDHLFNGLLLLLWCFRSEDNISLTHDKISLTRDKVTVSTDSVIMALEGISISMNIILISINIILISTENIISSMNLIVQSILNYIIWAIKEIGVDNLGWWDH